jgi:hypothetical protein
MTHTHRERERSESVCVCEISESGRERIFKSPGYEVSAQRATQRSAGRARAQYTKHRGIYMTQRERERERERERDGEK